jgi:hypothetical protein
MDLAIWPESSVLRAIRDTVTHTPRLLCAHDSPAFQILEFIDGELLDASAPRGVPVPGHLIGDVAELFGQLGQIPAPPGSFATHAVVYATGDSAGRTSISDESALGASLDTRSGAYESLEPAEAVARRSADAVAACVAQQVRADLFITNREYLHKVTWALGRGLTYCLPAGAFALVSLYLRAQGEFLAWKDSRGSSSASFNKGLFYQVGARELLPEASASLRRPVSKGP